MKRSAWRAALAVFCGLSTLPSAAQSVDRNEIVRQARESYYSLRSEGLTEFGCQVRVDWNTVFKSSGIQLDGLATNQLLPILEKTYFQVSVGSSSAPTVSRQSQVAPPNEEVAKRYTQTTSGAEAVLTGSLQIWSMFMLSPPLPNANSNYQLEEQDDKYRLTYNAGSSNFVVTLAHDFSIDEVRVTEPKLEAIFRPAFVRLKDGLLLVGYEYVQNPKEQPVNAQHFSAKIEYREVQGLKLPSAVNVVRQLASAKLEIPLMFTDCHVKKRVVVGAGDETSDRRSANIRSTPNVADAEKAGSESGAGLTRPETAQPGTRETQARVAGNLEVLSDTRGADFGPYLTSLLQTVRANWYKLIPDEARPPLLKQDRVSIELRIMPDGKITGMKIVDLSGIDAFDRAAWGGITASVPLHPLPREFHGPYLALRFHFYYNPAHGDIE